MSDTIDRFRNKIRSHQAEILRLQNEIDDMEQYIVSQTSDILVPHFNKTVSELDLVRFTRTETGIGLSEDKYYFICYGILEPSTNRLYTLESSYIRDLLQIPSMSEPAGKWEEQWKSVRELLRDEGPFKFSNTKIVDM